MEITHFQAQDEFWVLLYINSPKKFNIRLL